MRKKNRIGIMFLDEIHHVFHFITVAKELSKTNFVDILTYPGEHTFLKQSLLNIQADKVRVLELKTHFFRAFTDTLKNRDIPRKGFWVKKNAKKILTNYDALIFTDYTHHKFLKYRALYESTTKFLKFPHGAPGRSYSYNKELLDFDLQLIFGKFQYEEYKKKNLLGPHPITPGYPKIDAVTQLPKKKHLFNNDKITVVYNPHFSKPLSSWYSWGIHILDYFLAQNSYNLIFAPHINLFNKTGFEDKSNFPEIYTNAENIHIDLGSDNSVDMTYTLQADIYLGDVSSQVYEFIINPRPCIFLNSNQESYHNKLEFRFWQMGAVINEIEELDNRLKNSLQDFENYKDLQVKINQENFHKEKSKTASQLAAEEIDVFLNS
ncbi:CDP-glycerol glycerophosphotransferase family protein [Mesonia ostreae]|uniref:CDP-glycerol glycerophosphotransferase family protein n=1 Tax=Mesonia ostreae TaxID=861110 RepID=A0ABU2KGR3_9FLAO|nr:CDP-glycerol glycerophosphotransferase family protein [Mesonia ostreae]MDT0293879.1 CDP-glycerol glycerophosphotransferase family protein [Mesonia ostreae]